MVVGANGAGKTNLLEGVHMGSQGFSLRTRRDARAVRFGTDAARITLEGHVRGARRFNTEVTVDSAGGRRILLDGAPVASSDTLRRHLPVLAFTPDRLAVVKGGPIVRRTYLDRTVGRVLPAKAELPGDYARALAQRNAALRRVRSGAARTESVLPWTEAVARLGTELDAVREAAVAALAPCFTASSTSLGLADGSLAYTARLLTSADLQERLARDIERGTTGLGPHLHDLAITAGSRDLRSFGSQGEQRLGVLALLLAEAGVLQVSQDEPPVLLLDDVLSELDDARKASLIEGLPSGGQTLITATSLRLLPLDCEQPALVVDVTPGRAVAR